MHPFSSANHDFVDPCLSEQKSAEELQSESSSEAPSNNCTAPATTNDTRRNKRKASSKAYREREKQKKLHLQIRHAVLKRQVEASYAAAKCFHAWEAQYRPSMTEAYTTNNMLLDAVHGLLLERAALCNCDLSKVTELQNSSLSQIITTVSHIIAHNNCSSDTSENMNAHSSTLDSEFLTMLELLAQESGSSTTSSPKSPPSTTMELSLPSISLLTAFKTAQAPIISTHTALEASLKQLQKANQILRQYMSMLQQTNAQSKCAGTKH